LALSAGSAWRCEILRPVACCLTRADTKSRSGCEPGNRRLADVVAAGNAAMCLASRDPLPRLAPLMRGEFWLAAESYALGLRVGSAARGALGNAPARRFSATANILEGFEFLL